VFGNIHDNTIAHYLQSEKAREEREKMKACRKNCLQSCWGRPEADRLSEIVKIYLQGISKGGSQERVEYLKRGIETLKKYEKMCKEAVI
jgi:hypothetical protein